MSEVKVFLCMDRDVHLTTQPATPEGYYEASCLLAQATEKDSPSYTRIDDPNGMSQCMRTGDALDYLKLKSL